MHHGRCHWSRALCQVSGRACSCKKDPCWRGLVSEFYCYDRLWVAWLCPYDSFKKGFIVLQKFYRTTYSLLFRLGRGSPNIYQNNLLKVKFEKQKQSTLQHAESKYTIRYDSFPLALKNGGCD